MTLQMKVFCISLSVVPQHVSSTADALIIEKDKTSQAVRETALANLQKKGTFTQHNGLLLK